MSVPLRTERVEDERPLLAMLRRLPDDERFAFVQDDEGLVGWGVAARIPVGTGERRFARAREGFDAFVAGLRCEGSAEAPAPLALASFAFDPDDGGSVAVIPRTVIRRHGGMTWRTTIGARDEGSGPGTVRGAEASSEGNDRPRYAGSTVRDDRWIEVVANAIRAIDDGEFEKVVLARDLHVWSRTPFDPASLAAALGARFPSCWTFLVDDLIGASPERLLRRRRGLIESRVLAGTTARGVTPEEDATLGEQLLRSTKDLHEHALALRSAVEALARHCTELSEPPTPSLVRLENVQHLGSDLSGQLRQDSDTHVLTLLADLHPTAAVGGAPRGPALRAIRAHEGIPRGRYAAPVGWFTSDGDGDFAIALRCAEVHGTRARLFAGAGIVAGSLPEAELAETWLKLKAMMSVLG